MTDMGVKCWAGRQAVFGARESVEQYRLTLSMYRHREIDAQVSGRACWAENHSISIVHAISFTIMLWIAGNEFVVGGSRGMG